MNSVREKFQLQMLVSTYHMLQFNQVKVKETSCRETLSNQQNNRTITKLHLDETFTQNYDILTVAAILS